VKAAVGREKKMVARQFPWLLREEEELAVAVRFSSVFRRVFAMRCRRWSELLLLWCGEGATRSFCCFRRVSVVAGEEMAAAAAMVMEGEEKIRVRVLGDEDDDVAAFHWTAC